MRGGGAAITAPTPRGSQSHVRHSDVSNEEGTGQCELEHLPGPTETISFQQFKETSESQQETSGLKWFSLETKVTHVRTRGVTDKWGWTVP